MKLVYVLAQELPKRGGWKFNGDTVYQDWDGEIRVDTEPHRETLSGLILPLSDSFRQRGESKQSLPEHGFVTRNQYEEAVFALSQPPVWQGECLPPVGCEVELVNFYGEDFPEFVGENGEKVKIIGNGFTNGRAVAFYEADGGRGSMISFAVANCFRPIRTEAERKREEVLAAMLENVTNYNKTDVIHAVEQIYNAIEAGKIKGLYVEGKL